MAPLWVEVQADKFWLVDACRSWSCAEKPLGEDNHPPVDEQKQQRTSQEPHTEETWSIQMFIVTLPAKLKQTPSICKYCEVRWVNTGVCQVIWPPGPGAWGFLRWYNLQIFMYRVGAIDFKK